MRFEIPDFSLLTELIPGVTSLKGRVVILHFPTHTVLELLHAEDPLSKTVSPCYEWERINKYGEIDKFTFIVHRYVTDDLTAVFEQAKEWYRNIIDWLDTSDDAFDRFLREWENHSDDLPN
ncbi:hypothetical protein JHJ32_00460 [Parapedobacter sp. ISTM3]|uniref:Uncharacterized protein n=1 Tax=Parapedobacter luteus TaxID=623280 RepID=A0A1T5DCF9_9SPHI|nr:MULTISPECIES: hypothetical protein [Parapedobacter]MBK1438443.1 hypothetical protein [Parapedobacter sp. ISTM3]SKB69311.1 hypothetical protein SAMN05660226_02702 [Parapedobacter luteus]